MLAAWLLETLSNAPFIVKVIVFPIITLPLLLAAYVAERKGYRSEDIL